MAEDTLLDALRRIDTKLAALLTIAVDAHLRNTDIAKPRPRTIDTMLVAVGLTQNEVAGLLGKSQQAVAQAIQKDKEAAKKPTGNHRPKTSKDS